MIWSKKQTIDGLMSILTDVSYRIVNVSGKIGARVSDWFMSWLIIAIGQLNEPIEESLGQFERSNKLDSNERLIFFHFRKMWVGSQVQQVVTGRSRRKNVYFLHGPHYERHRHTTRTPRETHTHD